MSTLVSRLYDWVTDKANSVKITASRMDAEFDQMVTKLNQKVLCATSAPESPIAGQTWIDTTNNLLKIYLNNEWVVHGPVHIDSSAASTPYEGMLWYDTSNNLLKAYNGSSWDTIVTNVNGLTEKTSVVDADEFIIADSADSNAHKKVTLANVVGSVQTLRGWIKLNGTGTIAIEDHYNVSGITDNGAGDYTITWDTDFANANYSVVGSAGDRILTMSSQAVGSIRVQTRTYDGTGTPSDISQVYVQAIGDQ